MSNSGVLKATVTSLRSVGK